MFPATDPVGELTYIMSNGPNDPSFYIVRTKNDAAGPIGTAPGLPGVVYARVVTVTPP